MPPITGVHGDFRLANGEPCCLGIDEAGRGPVLGPMVYGAAWCTVAGLEDLKKKKFADSKTLTPEKRAELFDGIKECNDVGWAVDVLSAKELSGKMLRIAKYNLNAISHDSAIGLIQIALQKGVNVFVDTVGDPAKYEAKLGGMFPNIKFTVAKKADSLYAVVSAASICAKVTRDEEMNQWTFDKKLGEITTTLGSGYPSDPTTKAWLEANLDPVFGFPDITRFSWKPVINLMATRGVPVDLYVCEPPTDNACRSHDDEDEDEAAQPKIGFTPQRPAKRARCQYWADRSIERVAEF